MRKSFVVPVEVSARHVHFSPKDFFALYGNEAKLTLARNISEPGQFAANERVNLTTTKGIIERVRIVGPLREYSQVELSKTDAFSLGLEPPIRRSHELELDGTPGITLTGPNGKLVLEKGVIIPWRHLHISEIEALEYQLAEGELLKIRIRGERSIIFENVLVDINPHFRLSFHLDTDEGNAASVGKHTEGEVVWF